MARRIPEDKAREDRIIFDIVVDAYNDTERAMGWYCYLQDRLQVPFQAICRSSRSTSPLKVGNVVEVRAMASEDDCTSEVHVVVGHAGQDLAVPLGQLECKSGNPDTRQAVEDWRYWQSRGYEF